MSDVLVCITGDSEHPEHELEAEAIVVERRGPRTRYVLPDGRWFDVDAVEAAAAAGRNVDELRAAA